MRKIFTLLIVLVMAVCNLQIALARPVKNKQPAPQVIAILPSQDAEPEIIRGTRFIEFSPPVAVKDSNKSALKLTGYKRTFRQSIYYPPENYRRE